jgi:hypothetical protein
MNTEVSVRIAISDDQRAYSRMTALQNACRSVNEYVLCRRSKDQINTSVKCEKKTGNKVPVLNENKYSPTNDNFDLSEKRNLLLALI